MNEQYGGALVVWQCGDPHVASVVVLTGVNALSAIMLAQQE